MRSEKSYSGEMMAVGTANEEAVLAWLRTTNAGQEILDLREFRIAQRMDVDFGITTVDRTIVLAEIKSDKWLGKTHKLLFENHRINHYVRDKWFYLGWGWRSPAQKLIIRNPDTGHTCIFTFADLRAFIGRFIAGTGSRLQMQITETDDQKTTFNLLIPFSKIPHVLYKTYTIPPLFTCETIPG